MSNPTYTHRSSETGGGDPLAELALDLRWSWSHAADDLWAHLDAELWEQTHNPWVVLQAVSADKLESALAGSGFRALLERVLQQKREVEGVPGWFQQAHAGAGLTTVAYFSMEFMLSEALPIYSGGLGNVAGDQLKAASDLAVPIAGVGLLYQQGYFRQMIDAHGVQHALYPFNDPGQIPITPLRGRDGEWLRLPLILPGFQLWVRTWQARVGRRTLYLLDTNDPANLPEYRGITSELYGGGAELRLMQELILGIAGWRLLRAIGIHPDVCHLNEGHAAFAVLERAHSWMQEFQQPFSVALEVTRAGNLFTTHTPVEAGFDRFAPELMRKYLKFYAEERLRIGVEELLALGRRNPADGGEPFNMAYLALRGSGAVNGVSRLHGEVSRRIFQPLFPRWPATEVPIGYITNGIHTPAWDSAAADALWTEACGKDRWYGELEGVGEALRAAPDERLWEMRCQSRRKLVEYVRKRQARQLAAQGATPQEVASAAHIFDPNALTVGFARRFAEYKRPNLLLHDRQRLVRILCGQRPVQLVVAGKAHPQDGAGQAMIREWHEFLRQPEVRSQVVFLADYDVLMAEQLVEGMDVWLNTPRRPWEASGTSGMKVLVNGGLNLSELDGWWAEAYAPEVGWSLGDGKDHGADPAWDAAEAEALYQLLEQEVVPEFYRRDTRGVPTGWLARMRESMARLTPRFSANRAVREYTETYYLPAAAAYRSRAAQGGLLGKDLVRWKDELARRWEGLRFGTMRADQQDGHWLFEVEVYLGDIDPNSVRVELFAEGRDGGASVRYPMQRGPKLTGSVPGYLYSVPIAADRPSGDYTPRVIPHHDGVSVPLEAAEILWQR